jgi:hypothetical protein
MHFMESAGFLDSSIMYSAFIEGRAMNTNINEGVTVQNVSISCPSDINLLNLFLFMEITIM